MYQQKANRFVMAAESAVRRRLLGDQKRLDDIFESDYRLEMLASLAGGSRTIEEIAKMTGYETDAVQEELHETSELGVTREFTGRHWNYLLDEKHPAYVELQDLTRVLAVQHGFNATDPIVSKAKGKHVVGRACRVVRDADKVASDAKLNSMWDDEDFAARYRGCAFVLTSSFYERDSDGSVVEHFVYDVVSVGEETTKKPWTQQMTLKGNRTPGSCAPRDPSKASNIISISDRRRT